MQQRTTDFAGLLARAETLMERVELVLTKPVSPPDWKRSVAFRWRKRDGQGTLQPVTNRHKIRLDDLRGVDEQKRVVERNTRQFVVGLPANNVLLTGARGTGNGLYIRDPDGNVIELRTYPGS